MSGVATGQIVRFQVFADPELVIGVFDVIETWRSRDLEEGPYEEITGDVWAPATLSVSPRPYSVSGETLVLRVNESHDVSVLFTGSDPISVASITAQITTQSLGLLDSSTVNGPHISTVAPGAAVTLRVVPGDAASILGLPTEEPDAVAFGKDARPALLAGVESYTITDPHGSSAYFYKIRFRNQATQAVSEFSAPFSGAGNGGVDFSRLVRGYLKLVDMLGSPVPNYNVVIKNTFRAMGVDDQTVIGAPIQLLTDANGEISVSLVRGLIITVGVAGTNLVREVTVPTDTAIESFNLLSGSVGTDDVFVVQVPNVPYANRRSL